MENFFLQLPSKTLRGKFLTFNIPIMLFALSCVFIVFALFDYKASLDTYNMRLDYLIDTSKDELSYAIANNNLDRQKHIVSKLISDPNIVKIVLLDKDDNMIIKSEKDNKDNVYYITERNNQLFNTNNFVGTIKITASAKNHLKSVVSRLMIDLYLSLFSVLVMILSALLINRYTIDTPLEKLLQAIQISKKTNTNQTVSWNSKDEIGAVVDAFNEMQLQIQEQTKTLTIAKEEAIASNKAKSEFLANISHELRTPMHAILGLTKIYLKKLEQWDTATMRETLNEIKSSSERLLALLNELLDLSKLESGKMQFDMRQHNLLSTTEWVLKELTPLAQEKHLNVVINSAKQEDLFGEYDYFKIGQVIRNLCSNAIKFSYNDSIIIITLEADKFDYLIFSISDNGIGIPAAETNTIFDKFVQSSNTKTGAGGTGLGLSICKSIITKHNGTIIAEQDKERGTIFTFRIPKKVRGKNV